MPVPVLPLFCFGFDGPGVPPGLRRRLEQGLGGVLLFRRNLVASDQIARLTDDLAASAAAPLLIGVDQEGGRVARLPEPFLTLPPAARLGLLDDQEAVRRLYRAVGDELLAVGINWNLAPVLDLWTNPANRVIGDRAFGRDPDRVARLGLAAIRGLREAGVLETAKHFPGHGETHDDSHQRLPESPQPPDLWRRREVVPFRQAIAAGVSTVMVAHLLCPSLDPSEPSSLSRPIITGLLRQELGFEGVVASDDLEMGAITERLGVGEAAVRFLEAGGDLILVCEREERQAEALTAVEEAVRSGRISEARIEESLRRLGRLRRQCAHGSGETDFSLIGSPDHRRLLTETLSAIADVERQTTA